jgi:protein TIF31
VESRKAASAEAAKEGKTEEEGADQERVDISGFNLASRTSCSSFAHCSFSS